jgi:hypothetical protein
VPQGCTNCIGCQMATCHRLTDQRALRSLQDGELTVAADLSGVLSSDDALANVYKLGERKWRRNRKQRRRRDYITAPFAAAKRRWQESATADSDIAAQ